MNIIAGIDVGKWSLDVSVSGGAIQRFENTQAGLRQLGTELQSKQVTRVVCEATGGYERALVKSLQPTAIEVHVAHPNKVRAFARACGYLAKTDRLDAVVLSRYGECFEAPAVRPDDAANRTLQGLLRRRRQLLEQRTQELNRLEKRPDEVAQASCKRHLAWLNEEIATLDRSYQTHLEQHERLSKQAALYQSVRGIGLLTAATLVAELPELGRSESKALTALVGLAPWACDSGQRRGYRSIRGGRASVRRALYMAAMSCVRYDGEMRRFYRGLRQRGKAGKVAIVAVMRKLLLVLNAVAKRGTPWIENYSPAT